MSNSPKNAATIALYSIDPIALDSFHSFDPESFSVIPLIADALIIIGLDGEVQPGLAVSWKQVSPVETDFEIRQGVTFHNGDPLTADDVVATFAAHRGPTPSACGGGILSPITQVEKRGEFSVRMTTAFPDGMLLRRLFFSQIYPKSILEGPGRDALAAHPIGTGAYTFEHWKKGDEIFLRRNPNHWAQQATVDELHFPILRQKEWTRCLTNGQIDIAFNADSHQVTASQRIDGLHSASRPAALSQWFLLANKGPLANPKVRRALNHAINQRLLVNITEHGHGDTQRTVATEEQEGHNPNVTGYRYSPAIAQKMLAEAGYPDGFTLSGLVSDTSSTLFSAVREFLGRVGVTLEAEVVPRADWISRVVVSKITGQGTYSGDFAVASVDNPLLHSLFHQFIFLFSDGPFSITNDADYDQAFLKAATEVNPDKALLAQQELEQYVRDQALLLFTVKQNVHMIARTGYSVDLPRSGHFDAAAVWSLTRSPEAITSGPYRSQNENTGESGRLLDATSHLGLFHLQGGEPIRDASLNNIWRNIQASEQRWNLQMEPMVRELVNLSDARNNLDNVLQSTNRVAIVGISTDDTQVFSNAGYTEMFGPRITDITQLLGDETEEVHWAKIRAEVALHESWAGPVNLPVESRPEGAPSKLYLTVTPARDAEGHVSGHTLVFSDFSGEEERIRSRAVRTILDHVTSGLFRTDVEGTILGGYSRSCTQLLQLEDDMTGRRLTEVLRLPERKAEHYDLCLMQVALDFMPEEATVGQLPTQVHVGNRELSLKCSVIRDERDEITSLMWIVVDITAQIEAEADAQRQKGIVQVLRFKSRFAEFVQGVARDLNERQERYLDDDVAEREHHCRMILHTAKGVFGQFNLLEIASLIHEVEESPSIGLEQIETVQTAIRTLMAEHHDVWGIVLGDTKENLSVNRAEVSAYGQAMEQATDLSELRKIGLDFVRRISRRRVSDFIGPLAESCAQHAQARGKQVTLEVVGLDCRASDHLAPVFTSLTHLVRNAIDHGIEAPEDRGDKPMQSIVRLSIREGADGLRIHLQDDGRGINGDVVAQKAFDAGQITAEAMAQMTQSEKAMLVFVEGLSTAEAVTETSGRGVGMIAVKTAVEQLGGEIHIHSEVGQGTRVEFFLSQQALDALESSRSLALA